MVVAYIGLGSNLEQPRQQLESALAELHDLPQSICIGHSSLYRSAPLVSTQGGSQDQPDYINAVAALETALEPLALLEALQGLENAHGRERTEHWGPRTLDLDLLLYGEQIMDSETLTIPHPGLYDRNFVLYPLAELVDAVGLQVVIPGRRSLQDLLQDCERGELEKISH